MSANNNVPMGHLPWRLTAAPPGTLDILVDVESPVSWEIGGETSGQVLSPLFGDLPLLSGRGKSTIGRKGKFKLFIPDTENRDDVLEALIAARLDPDAPYYTWQALDGSQSWKVLFSSADNMTIGYLSGHRVVDVTFIQVASNTPASSASSATIPVPGAPPSVSSLYSQIQYSSNVQVSWANVVANSPADYIAIYRSTGVNIPPDVNGDNYGKLGISTKSGAGTIVFTDSDTGFNDFQLWMYLGVGPSLVPGPLLSRAGDTVFNIVSPAVNSDIIGPGASFLLNWAGIPNPSSTDRIVFASDDTLGSEYEIGTYPTGGLAAGSLSVPVPSSIPKTETDLFAPAKFSLIPTNSPLLIRTGRMAMVYVNINPYPAGSMVTANWGGLNSVSGSDAIGIIPAIDTNLTSAYSQITLPTNFGSQTFDLSTVPNGTYVRACLKVGSVFYISGDVFMVEN